MERFTETVRDSLKAAQNNEILIFGKRVEKLFGHVAGALGECKLIKSEDAGETFTSPTDEIIPPDYKLILNDGKQIFVEVKNCNMPNPMSLYTLKKNYVEKIERYGELHKIPVYYAIFFRCMGHWVLLPISSLTEHRKTYTINFMTALAKSEMNMLGDVSIGIKPKLTFELVVDKTKDVSIDGESNASFTIGDVKIYCDNIEIVNSTEKDIAFYLMMFGRWNCSAPIAIMDKDELQCIQYRFTPDTPENEELAAEQGFHTIGSLSSMITLAFNQQTIYKQRVTSIDARVEPSVFSARIPKGYKGEQLPLWIFHMLPNHDFVNTGSEALG
ncbi:hypothetical protein CS696_12935 [Salmonella enterica]|nr:hypothetical protein [Salmonella enterica]EDX6482753.1 hypothetical protein [Salmonella enterica subsp. enterica serovar Landwasser]HCL5133405.1 hypothetical protein [Salmonella enterica]